MLVLARKKGETIHLGDDIVLKVVEVSGDTVRLGIEAPQAIDIVRGELMQAVTDTNQQAIPADLSSLMRFKK